MAHMRTEKTHTVHSACEPVESSRMVRCEATHKSEAAIEAVHLFSFFFFRTGTHME